MSNKPRYCPCCDELMPDVKQRRRNTQYENDELNYLVSCDACYQQDWEFFQDLWDEYNRGRM